MQIGAYCSGSERELRPMAMWWRERDHRRATRVTGPYTAKRGQVTYSLRVSSTRPAAKLYLLLRQVQKECARLKNYTPVAQRAT